jgi:hypothetical protein
MIQWLMYMLFFLKFDVTEVYKFEENQNASSPKSKTAAVTCTVLFLPPQLDFNM